MVDTVRILLNLPVREELWSQIKSSPDINILGGFDVSYRREENNGIKVQVHRLTNTKGVSLEIVKGVLTVLSASIPRVLFNGSNTRLIRDQDDIDQFEAEMIKIISQVIEPGAPITLNYTRVDLVAYINLPTGRVRALFRDAQCRLVRKPPIDYITQGFVLPGSLLRVVFYDKELKQKKATQRRTRCEFQLHGRLLRKAITGEATTSFSHLNFNQLRELYIFLIGLFPTPLQEIKLKKFTRYELLGILSQCECEGVDLRNFVDGQLALLNKGTLRNARRQVTKAAINFANINLTDWLRPSELFREIDHKSVELFAQRLVPSQLDDLPALMRGCSADNSGLSNITTDDCLEGDTSNVTQQPTILN